MYEIPLIQCGGLILPNFVGNSRSSGISQLLAGKDGQKGPSAIFVIFVPLLFWGTALRVKKIHFHKSPFPHAKQFCRPAAVSILIPPTFYIASLHSYTPKVLKVLQKWIWCQQFGLQVLPK